MFKVIDKNTRTTSVVAVLVNALLTLNRYLLCDKNFQRVPLPKSYFYLHNQVLKLQNIPYQPYLCRTKVVQFLLRGENFDFYGN